MSTVAFENGNTKGIIPYGTFDGGFVYNTILGFAFCGYAINTGAEYGKIVSVGDDFVEFNIIDVDSMEYRETVIVNSQLILEAIYGGSDISRIIAEISSTLSTDI